MQTDAQASIARGASACIGTPFRLRGRCTQAGLDCIGLVEKSLESAGVVVAIPRDYTLRGDYQRRIAAFFDRDDFASVSPGAAVSGDIVMMLPSSNQTHFGVMTDRGLVHAHAGLRRVVLTPNPSKADFAAAWRYIGE